MLLNEICGKKVINSLNAKYEGVLSGGVVTRDLKEIAAFKLSTVAVSENGLREEKLVYIRPSCISSFKDALVTEGLAVIERPPDEACIDAPLGTPVFNINGLMYGYLIDICFGRSFAVTKLVYDRPFGIQKIISLSKDVIVAKAALKKSALYISDGKKRPPKDIKLPSFGAAAETPCPTANGESPSRYYAKYPKKIISDYTFLLGRTVGDDIRNIKNDIIIRRGSVITNEIVEKAGSYGKLVELTFASVGM
ncbi:MAG: hypothetical protein LBT30_07890 [Clostridiales bacterium]|jgi:hypothetical protein|nr:hypothetical protein [Clostridiales bacterium]